MSNRAKEVNLSMPSIKKITEFLFIWINMEGNNLGLYYLVWFDDNLKIFDDTELNVRLHLITTHSKKFNEIKVCHEYIEQRSKDDRLIILVNGFQYNDLLPKIHHFSQVSAIYIYSIDQSSHQQLYEHFPKVRISSYMATCFSFKYNRLNQ